MDMEGEEKRDLFSKLYTYDEVVNAVRAKSGGPKPDWARDLIPPAHWPGDCEVDPGKWVFWLPEGWGQAIKPTLKDGMPTGKSLQCFISPEPMKRYFHKPKVAEYCAKMGWPGLKEEEEKEDVPKKVRGVHDEPPKWPEDDFVPHTWRIAWRQLPSTLHKIYIPPGQDEGFLFHRSCVEEYLAKGKNLTPFEGSKPMAEISANAGTGLNKKAKKRKLRVATASDYESTDALTLTQIGLGESKLPVGLQADASSVKKMREYLLRRRFAKEGHLMCVSERSPGSAMGKLLAGIYYEKAGTYGERPCYQLLQEMPSGVACSPLHIFWSPALACWKVGHFDEEQAGFATCTSDQTTPAGLKLWSMMKHPS